jgi:hypothetical protein
VDVTDEEKSEVLDVTEEDRSEVTDVTDEERSEVVSDSDEEDVRVITTVSTSCRSGSYFILERCCKIDSLIFGRYLRKLSFFEKS